MDVGAELAASRCHAAQCFSSPDPLIRPSGVGEQLLDGRRGGGLQAGHGRRAEQDAVDGHQRVSVGQCPTAGEVFGRALGRTDATAHTDGDVGLRPQFGVGGQQEIVEVLPGVVTTGAAALDMGDDTLGGRLGGDPDD